MIYKFRITIVVLTATLAFSASAVRAESSSLSTKHAVRIDDVSRLNSTEAHEIIPVKDIKDLQAAVQRAASEFLRISIAGKRHSQGGHTFYTDTLVLDMTGFNRILDFDRQKKIISVQSGTTWKQIQDYINPYGLAVKVQQTSNIFTVGGSLSVNAHGRDPSYGPIIQTVQAFRLLKADGSIVQVSRAVNPELFSLVIGGYGLFGVIVDVDLSLTENHVLEKQTVALDYKEYPKFFEENIKGYSDVELHYARPSVGKNDFLKRFTVTSFSRTTKRHKGVFDLKEETGVERNKAFLSLSRKYQWGKDFRWFMQELLVDHPGSSKVVSRNNAMRPEVKFLEYNSPMDTDILQEYFFPIRNFVSVMDGIRNILLEEQVNLLSMTIRFIPRDGDSFLSFAREENFAAVLYLNQELSDAGRKKAERWTQKLVDLILAQQGTYFLPYQLYPTQQQIRRAYPMLDQFFVKKKFYDPQELFVNHFYFHYKPQPQTKSP